MVNQNKLWLCGTATRVLIIISPTKPFFIDECWTGIFVGQIDDPIEDGWPAEGYCKSITFGKETKAKTKL